MAVIEGGCYCGALRYRIDPDDSKVVNCHCGMCRRTSGAAYVTWILLTEDQFELVAGQPAELASSSHGRRWFCDRCGTPIAFRSSKRPGKVDITVCSLDEPEWFSSIEDVYVETKLAWVR